MLAIPIWTGAATAGLCFINQARKTLRGTGYERKIS